MRAIPIAVLGALIAASGTPVPAPTPTQAHDPSLKQLRRLVGAYVETYGQKASVLVASERYEQHVSSEDGVVSERQIVAEFAIVHDERRREWLGFRDVVQVDGKPITDHEQRLVGILTSDADGLDEARTLSDEGARFNIGTVYRNFNVPTAALFFFTPANLDRFKFSKRDRAQDGSVNLEFRETEKPTIIRAANGGSVPSHGHIWVDPATGTITRTDLRLSDLTGVTGTSMNGTVEVDVDVTYALHDRFRIWLPQTMRETYIVRNGERETGRADYSNYREYQVSGRIK